MGAPLPREDAPATGATATAKTLAITDLVDSTRLFATLGDRRAAELSARHERLARDLVVRFDGREIDKTDGFLLLFDRAVDAVRFALAYHRSLAELSEEEGVALEARVGIHLGEVILRANEPEDVARGAKPVEIEGYAKPLAARVTALAKARQTLLTRGAFDLARQAASREPDDERELRWLAHGPYVLKGVTEPVEIFEVGEAGFAPLLVPKSTAKARRAVSAEDEVTLGWRPAPGLEIPRRRHWRLAEKLGEGGFGEVWRGAHEKTGENRVFKFCYQPDRLRSLQREVTLFRLMKESLGSREDIARILDWNFDEAPYFLECEYTEGGNLLEWTAEQGGPEAVPLETRLELVAQVADALAAAHSVGVLHKDVKPSNVLVTTGRDGEPKVRLTDFGIGLVTDREVLASRGITVFDLTEMLPEGTDSAGGTHLYMAPELVEGRPASVQADVYALGVMLYQLVTCDFSRALASGWRRDVQDELLQEDVAALVDGRPERRMRDAQEVARRLRTLEERRRQREAERRAVVEREAQRRAVERAHRRRKAALAIAGGSIAVLAVVTVLALQALDARREAQRRRAQAEGLIGFMVGDLREKLEPIGRLDLLDEVGDQALAYFEAVPEEDLSGEELFRRTETLRQIGEIRVARGDLPAAMEAFRESLDLAQELVSRNPARAEWQKGLGASHFWVGFVHWRQNELDEAEAEFRAYQGIAESLAADDPDNTEWQIELAYTHSNLGSIFQSREEYEAARQELETALGICERLVAAHPDNTQWQLDLATLHNKLGDVLGEVGELDAALGHYQADLDIKTRLVRSDPANTRFRRLLATSHNFLGGYYEITGRLDESLQHFEQGVTIAQELVELDPANLGWQYDLAVHRERLGRALRLQGAHGRAMAELTGANEILERLVEADPTEHAWRVELVRARLHLGEALLAQDRRSEAHSWFLRARDLLLELRSPGSGDRQVDRLLSIAYTRLGDLEEGEGADARAREQWREALALIEPIARNSSNWQDLDALVRPLLRLGRLDAARPIVQKLYRLGYRDPDFSRLCSAHGLLPTEDGPLRTVG